MEQETQQIDVKEQNIDNFMENNVRKTKSGESNSKNKSQNKMREIEIEKIVLHCGGIDDKLERSKKLLEKITGGKKIYVVKSTRRIPEFGISPRKQSGCKITLRNKDEINNLLKRFFSSFDNRISERQITENQVCFGINEYIEVPGFDYEREIGILGFEVMIVFKRKGKRVKMRKIKKGKYPKKQEVTKEEIIDFLTKHFGLEVV